MSPTPGTLGVCGVGRFFKLVFHVCSGVRFCDGAAELQSGFVIFGLIVWIRSAHTLPSQLRYWGHRGGLLAGGRCFDRLARSPGWGWFIPSAAVFRGDP